MFKSSNIMFNASNFMLKSSNRPFSTHNSNIPILMESGQFLLRVCNGLGMFWWKSGSLPQRKLKIM